MNREEIAQRSQAIEAANPPYPAIYRGALFPAGAGAQPAIVPVPLDYGLGTYMFAEDLCTHVWGLGSEPAPGAVVRFKPAWRMDAGNGTVYIAFANVQKLSAANGVTANSVLSAAGAAGGKPRTVYGDVLFVKESLTRECIVNLGEADFNHVRERFQRWWAMNGADPDQVLS
ncbi:hypothetical protein MVEN_02471100 [Mycena venus]|uniref:Uncharacterized protein n=1 Tax=Mycena venus TaxID=2733690 RepID=A0A8H7CCC3_9AGAR|nr:hypothetical protein MVEN_02471100 [Mycena venus]